MINITGFTNNHVKNSNRKGIINFSNLFCDILNDNNYKAQHNIEADINIVFVNALSSINSSNAVNCLRLIKEKNCILALDDWNVKGFYDTNENILQGKFSATHPTVDKNQLMQYLDVIENINNGKYVTIFPAYKSGDHGLLNIPGNSIAIDPSIYIKKEYGSVPMFFFDTPIEASLNNKKIKRNYKYKEIKDVSESEVFEYYKAYRIAICKQHYHSGSGWFRNKYTLCNKAKCIIIEDKNSPFGSYYEIDYEPYMLIEEIYEYQNAAYNKNIMTKQEISNQLKLIL